MERITRKPLKIFIGGLTLDTKEDDLHTYFSKYGPVHDVLVIKNRSTNVSKGYGFVTAGTQEIYNKIIESKHHLNGRRLDCLPGFKKTEKPEEFDKFCNLRIFVGGISKETTDSDLYIYFESFGKIKKAFVIRNPHTQISRKFGFVIMENEEEADRLLIQKRHKIGNSIANIKRFSKEEDYKKMLLEKQMKQEQWTPENELKPQTNRTPTSDPLDRNNECIGQEENDTFIDKARLELSLGRMPTDVTETSNIHTEYNQDIKSSRPFDQAFFTRTYIHEEKSSSNLRFNISNVPRIYASIERKLGMV